MCAWIHEQLTIQRTEIRGASLQTGLPVLHNGKGFLPKHHCEKILGMTEAVLFIVWLECFELMVDV